MPEKLHKCRGSSQPPMKPFPSQSEERGRCGDKLILCDKDRSRSISGRVRLGTSPDPPADPPHAEERFDLRSAGGNLFEESRGFGTNLAVERSCSDRVTGKRRRTRSLRRVSDHGSLRKSPGSLDFLLLR